MSNAWHADSPAMPSTLSSTTKGWGSVTVSAELRKSLEEAATAYHAQVGAVAPYLMARGVTKETADTFRLGYVAEPMTGHEQYYGRLSIPYLTPTGISDVRFRSLGEDSGPKYLTRPGAASHLYNVSAFQVDNDYIAICEGEFDTMMACQSGVNAVGVPGATNWKDWYARAFHDYLRVFVLVDGDSAGKELGKRISQHIDVALVVPMPDGMDVNDFVLTEGPDALRKKVGL